MSSKLLINVNDANPVVVPDTDADTNAPDTGMFSVTHNDGVNNTSNMIAPIIGISVLAIVLITLIISLVRKQKSKKTNNFSIYSKKHTILRITGIMTLILITTFVALNYNTKQEDNVNAASNTLTVTTSDIEIDVDLKDKAVFATGESVVTVDSATTAGYTLMAYVDSTTTDLTNETNKSSTSTISMLESTYSQALTDNTWGMAITKPTSQDDTLFRGLPTTEEDAMSIKATSDATTTNDKTTIYYSTYITPDLDFGTYSGATITYIAVANVANDDVTVNYYLPKVVGSSFKATDGFSIEDENYMQNPVTYGRSQNVAYVGDSCVTSYISEEPYTIVKTSNIDDDGTQHGSYPVDSLPTNPDSRPMPSVNQVITIPGAAGIKAEIKYGLSGNSGVYLFKGNLDIMSDEFSVYERLYSGDGIKMIAPDFSSEEDYPVLRGDEEFVVSGDTITIAGVTWSEPAPGYDYGFYIKVYPIYAEPPAEQTVTEDTTCYATNSADLGEWSIENSFGSRYSMAFYRVFVPGASKIKMKINYQLAPAPIWILSAEGSLSIPSNVDIRNWLIAAQYSDTILFPNSDQSISGTEEFIFDSDTMTLMFYLNPDALLVEGRDYQFDVEFYPIYDGEHEGTTLVAMDSVTRKSGIYRELKGNSSVPLLHIGWALSPDDTMIDPTDPNFRPYIFPGESRLTNFLNSHYETYAGKTVNLREIVNGVNNGGVIVISTTSPQPQNTLNNLEDIFSLDF